MRLLLAVAMIAALACDKGEKVQVDRPTVDSVPADTMQGNDTVQMQVDSGEAVRGWPLFRNASFQAAEDSSTYAINWRVSSYTTGDTVQVRLVRDSVAGKVKRVSITKNRFTATGSVAIAVDRVYGTEASYSACTRLRKTTVKSEYCLAWKTNYPTKSKVDTMWVDSSQAVAYVRGMYVGSKLDTLPVQWCLFTKTKDGKMRIAANQRTIWGCQRLYDKFPAAQRLSDYRGIFFADGYYSVNIDVSNPAEKKIIIDFVKKTWTPA